MNGIEKMIKFQLNFFCDFMFKIELDLTSWNDLKYITVVLQY